MHNHNHGQNTSSSALPSRKSHSQRRSPQISQISSTMGKEFA